MEWYLAAIVTLFSVVLVSELLKLFRILIWRPYSLTKYFEKQGIRGPPHKFIYGSLDEIKKLKKVARDTVFMDPNFHDTTPKLIPHYLKWSSQFGETFMYWAGPEPRICIADPELVKQVLSNKFGYYTKLNLRPTIIAMVGKGLPVLTGLEWVKHRRILNPAFHIDKLKVMTKIMAECTLARFGSWETQISQSKDQCKEFEMKVEFQDLTADIIAHTAFGSSYNQGKGVFEAQREIQRYVAASSTEIFIPGSQYLPTRLNLQMWKLEKKIRKTLSAIIESRTMEGPKFGYGDDLLGMMIGVSEFEKNHAGPKLNMDDIIEECKTFYFTGHETTSNLLTWTLFLLSLNQEWQESLRQEVLKECGMDIPDAEMLNKLKLVNMVVLETLRLYCPVIMLIRKALEDIKLGELMVPKDTSVSIPIAMIHRSKKYWGEDANEFNPWRFSDGISKAAKHPNALLAFSIGPRACIGQNFAMMESKLIIAMLLQRFSFSLSPNYKHAPIDNFTVQPQFGLPLVVRPLNV